MGPTHDDITKKTLSEYFNIPLVINEEHLSFVKKKFYNYIQKNKKPNTLDKIEEEIITQAEILEDFEPIRNTIGTALGMTGKIDKTRIFVIPQLPRQRGFYSRYHG